MKKVLGSLGLIRCSRYDNDPVTCS